MSQSVFRVTVVDSLPGFWYSHYVGSSFDVVDDDVSVKGHVCKFHCYRVVGGSFDGDCISRLHASPVNSVSSAPRQMSLEVASNA